MNRAAVVPAAESTSGVERQHLLERPLPTALGWLDQRVLSDVDQTAAECIRAAR